MGCALSSGPSVPSPRSSRFFRKYELAELIGEGSFSEVRAARLRSSLPGVAPGADLAVKMVVFENEHGRRPQRVHRERHLWLKLGRHPNIVALQAHYVETLCSTQCAFFVMERCFGNLRDRLPQQHEVKAAVLDLLEAVNHVHSCGILHRDIKLTNLLWSYTTVKLCDFATAHELDSRGCLTTTTGTAPYMSPEMASGLHYGYPTDIWSSGVVIYCFLYEKFPFIPPGGRIDARAFKRAVLHDGDAEFIPCAQSDDIVSLCRAMLTRRACARPNAACALEQMRAISSKYKDGESGETVSTISDASHAAGDQGSDKN